MVQFYDEIPPFLINWIKTQHVFWVATAPLSADGHVNLSGKGINGTFHVVNNRQIWYEDLTGSGCETISHIRENGRITIYFNAFEGPPRIARLFGKGKVYEFGTLEYNELVPPEERQPGSRSIIMVDVHKVATSCGYGIPFFEFKSQRTKYTDVALKKEAQDCVSPSSELPSDGLKAYWKKMNSTSLDGLPGMELLPVTVATQFIPKAKASKPKALSKFPKVSVALDERLMFGFALGVLTVLVGGQLNSLGSLRNVGQFFRG
ncbi:hypothetical protein E1B28_006087 [Marasmius oreades]|uniref:Pyridoxamine 5'-phosphate oxidase putative domain-containing protein n=1 Tax=Marasmius oreades TaxID=181124 RepID=A0A9P7S4S4_9AGAR|nr:uncharacterized protein E1B28_006087 [Marasmius oreades]KAG7095322.1 hypothetical protein E1B28_006087 [Marasmius oreades]